MVHPSDQRAAYEQTVFEQPFSGARSTSELLITESETIFQLLDTLLPFEVCLHYQILPLSLTADCLQLGMIEPDDEAALDYVQRLLAYKNCSVVPQPIALDTHRALLSAYLKHAEQRKAEQSKLETTQVSDRTRVEQSSPAQSANPSATIILEDTHSDERAETVIMEMNHAQVSPSRSSPEAFRTAEVPPQPVAEERHIPTLTVRAKHLDQPLDNLVWLHPKELLQELLARVLCEGIGRLYLECGEYTRRIILSQNGASQDIMQRVSFNLFNGVLEELKLMAGLPKAPLEESLNVNLERLYQGESVLLRLKFMPSASGERATLQVLRGRASKFYEQQKLSKLGEDALTLVRQLQSKLNDINTVYRTNPTLSQQPNQALAPLCEALMQLDQNLREPFFDELLKLRRSRNP